MGRETDGQISLTSGDLGQPAQGHLLKNKVSVRDSAIVTIKHVRIGNDMSQIEWRNQFDLWWPWKVRSGSSAEKTGFLCEIALVTEEHL